MKTEPIRVLVAVDHPVVRRGLVALLLGFNDLLLAGEARNGIETLELCAKVRPDVVLMDLLLPDMDGAEATTAIRERYPDMYVIIMTSWNEYDLVQRALAAGARNYLLQNVRADDLACAIREACLNKGEGSALHQKPGSDLTVRELEVLALMARGLTNGEIAEELIISYATVKFHVSSILRKLSVASRTEAVALAVQNRLTYRPDIS